MPTNWRWFPGVRRDHVQILGKNYWGQFVMLAAGKEAAPVIRGGDYSPCDRISWPLLGYTLSRAKTALSPVRSPRSRHTVAAGTW